MVSRDNLLTWINLLQQVYAENKQYLTQLDSAIGDADHGINMDRGFTTAKAELEKVGEQDISATLNRSYVLNPYRGGCFWTVIWNLFYAGQRRMRQQE